MRTTGPLYLAVIDKPTSNIWLKKPMGVNTLDNIMKNMIENSPLAKTINKKVTNHMMRKTLVKKLKNKHVPKSDIITVTGHKTEAGLDDYDSGNEEHQESISHKIDLPCDALFNFRSNRNLINKDDPRIANPCFSLLRHFTNPLLSTANQNNINKPHNPFASHPIFSLLPYLQQQIQPSAAPVQNHFHFNNCFDLKISGLPQQPVSSPQQKKKRVTTLFTIALLLKSNNHLILNVDFVNIILC